MNKKAQGISLNVVVIAAIALLVLIVLAVIFMVRLGIFSGTSAECAGQGGKCLSSCNQAPYTAPYSAAKCSDSTKICCVVGG